MGKKQVGRSFFSNLPLELRRALRSQTLVPLVPGANINDVEVKAELINLTENNGFLPTQPPSPPDSAPTEDVIVVEENDMEYSLPAESSTSGAKRSTPSSCTNTRSERPRRSSTSRKDYSDHAWDCTGLVRRYTSPKHFPANLVKYWYQRHFLLPQYDKLPLLLDDTGWFSITPQPIAQHIAERCRCDVIVDAFCGVGGNAIEFAKTCERVIAIDNNSTRLRIARHNALHLGVADRIEFVLADYIDWANAQAGRGKESEVDVIFLSPPWGGTEYLSFSNPDAPDSNSYPLSAILPIPGKELFDLTGKITPNIAYYLPRNVNIQELSDLAPILQQPKEDRDKEWVEVEEEWVGDKLKAVTAYFGGLVAE